MESSPNNPGDKAHGASALPRIHAPAPLRALAVIPARIGSTRLPRKMLLEAGGLPLFAHTVRNVMGSGEPEGNATLARVVVATDSEEIMAAAREHGIEALMTSADHRSGTDRVHEALGRLSTGGRPFDVVLNVQGDEPELPLEQINLLVSAFSDPEVQVATLCAPVFHSATLKDPAVVKVVRATNGNALYFSRSTIPSRTHAREDLGADAPLGWRHVGVYAFRPAALARFCALPPGELEVLESLEQLRWLEAGHSIRCLAVDHVSPGIDTQVQFEAFRSSIEDVPEA
ncbi:MAG: 3-deoxy-manno-octulosonate cytidylyltransferase (CMP-KDO synthetase) [Planctomycetota bacterium]|jgi:3-deoxy-manno-octulosonate cytidylyltransferase (CMP-KDO synthetase)